MSTSYIKHIFPVVTLLGLVGCASTSELDALRAEIRQTNETAQSAMAKAEDASREAAAAAQAADEAKAIARETDSKIDRMFKKSMYK